MCCDFHGNKLGWAPAAPPDAAVRSSLEGFRLSDGTDSAMVRSLNRCRLCSLRAQCSVLARGREEVLSAGPRSANRDVLPRPRGPPPTLNIEPGEVKAWGELQEFAWFQFHHGTRGRRLRVAKADACR